MRAFFLLGIFILQSLHVRLSAQVNLQSGAAEFSLPLYRFEDAANRVGHDIVLGFTNGNGLRVSEIASQVGTGWSLQMGGMISRLQRGEADDQKQYTTYTDFNSATYANDYYPNGVLNKVYSNSINDGLSITPLYSTSNVPWLPHPKYLEDRERDIFEFAFAGRSGQFVISAGTGAGSARTLMDSKLKIERVEMDMISSNIRTRIAEFHITDEQGIKYVFKDIEFTEALKYDDIRSYSNSNNHSIYSQVSTYNSGNGSVTLGRPLGQYVAERWYLTEIINPLTNRKITFEYEDYDIDLNAERYYQKDYSGSSATFALRLIRQKGKCKRIKAINSSAREKVEFVYSSAYRVDVPSDKYLEKIKVSYQGQLRYQWNFSMGYFCKNEIKPVNYQFSDVEKPFARLCLVSVKRTGANGESENPYQFDYYLGDINVYGDQVPANFSYFHDHFGYSNGTTDIWPFYSSETNTDLYTVANSNFIYVLPINNPTQYRQVKPGLAKNGILKTVWNPSGGSVSFEYEQNQVRRVSSNTVVYGGGVRVSKVTTFDGADHTKDQISEYQYLRSDNTTSGWGYNDPVYSKTYLTDVSTCGSYAYPGISHHQIAGALFNSTVNQMHRILVSGMSTTQAIGQIIGSAVLSIAFNVFVNMIIGTLNDDAFQTTQVSSVSDPMNYDNALPLQYARVKVSHRVGNVSSGKTVYEFTSDQDNAVLIPNIGFPFSGRQRLAYWFYGLPKEVIVYTGADVPVKRTVNHYNYMAGEFIYNSHKSEKWGAHKRTYMCWLNVPSNPTTDLDVTADIYYPVMGRTELTQTDEYIYNASGNYVMTTTNYEYSQENFLVSKITNRNTRGDIVDKYIYYSADYLWVPGPAQMASHNIFNVPVGTQTLYDNIPNGRGQYFGSAIEFGTAPNGDFKPLKTYTFSNSFPVDEFDVEFDPAELYPSGPWYKLTATVDYNNKGVPVSTTTQEGKSCAIYDYDNQLIIAQVSNAHIGQVAYTSFESDGKGEWEWMPGHQVLDVGGVTGHKSYSGSLQKQGLPTGDYRVTLWCHTAGNPTVNGVTGATVVTVGGWKLQQWTLTGITSVQITGQNLDEVRLYPVSSQMKTTCYEPMVGKSADCDVSNRITYYHYDGLGRLKLIQDENRNVIKAYEYNFKQ